MKTKKIRNIDRSVCVGEQKVAYNMAFRAHINCSSKYEKLDSEMEKSAFITKIRDLLMEEFRSAYDYKPGEFNEDVIFVALNQGLKNYMENFFIASEYEQIGKAFPIPYEI